MSRVWPTQGIPHQLGCTKGLAVSSELNCGAPKRYTPHKLQKVSGHAQAFDIQRHLSDPRGNRFRRCGIDSSERIFGHRRGCPEKQRLTSLAASTQFGKQTPDDVESAKLGAILGVNDEKYDEEYDEEDVNTDGDYSEADSENVEEEDMYPEFHIPGRVSIDAGAGGLPRATLTHVSGSVAEVYLFGANVTSFRTPNGAEVLYVRPDAAFDGVKPISGGIPICFPQFGPGGDSPGALPAVPAMQQHGFARNLAWEVVASGSDLGYGGHDVGLALRLCDNDYTRAMWDFPFELIYEVNLGEDELRCSLTVSNPGEVAFPFTAALHTYVSVFDVEDKKVNLVGLQDTRCYDKAMHPTKLRVRDQTEELVTFDGGLYDSVFVDTAPTVGLNVGTGASVLVSNTSGFTDTVVWNPGKEAMPGWYRDFVCVESGRVARPVKLPSDAIWESEMVITVLSEEAVLINEEQEIAELMEGLNEGERV
ncbi:hypothetical protein CYMTET_11027 [Cymbomonas tetramitiformis]|uniref:glucose-6-phosphate 1-epimerase n=1 Tax=Cymbomonas tetramitiformis TaxID=36881 RepID=A0AAE0GPH0_9CHLO|nr:hypothetical protein CYMTET_11027 [Cymbomonas tetramitiformis]